MGQDMGFFSRQKTDTELVSKVKETALRLVWLMDDEPNPNPANPHQMEECLKDFADISMEIAKQIEGKAPDAVSPELRSILPVIGSVDGPLYLTNAWMKAVAREFVQKGGVERKNPFLRFAVSDDSPKP